jgi:heptosyltransferase I
MKNILIIRLSAIGDVIHVIPSLCLLREYFKNDYIGWVTTTKASDLLINNKIVNKTFILSNNFPKSICYDYAIIYDLYKIKWDIIIDYQNILKSLILRLFLRGPVFTYSYKNCYLLEEKISCFFSHYTPPYIKAKSIIEQELLLTNYVCGNKYSSNNLYFVNNFLLMNNNIINEWIRANNIENKKIIIIAPNTSRVEKQISYLKWIEIAKKLKDKDKNIAIIVIGYQLSNYTKQICDSLKDYIYIAPLFDLETLGHLLLKSILIITHDSCVLHLSNILNCKVIGLFGPTEALWYGGNYNPKCKYISANIKYIRHKNYLDKKCINNITVEEIIEII